MRHIRGIEIGCRKDDGGGGSNENNESIKEKRKYDDIVEALCGFYTSTATRYYASEQQ